MTATATATYTKLKDGTWGVRAPAGVTVGQQVTVTKKSGESKVETVAAVLWTGIAKDGRPASLVTIAPSARGGRSWDAGAFAGYGAPRGGLRRACVSGGNCSSMGGGKGCGGHDCDGW